MRLFEKLPPGVYLYGHSCLMCPRKENIVILEVVIEGDPGVVGICAGCVGKLAKVVGWISPERAEILVGQHDELTERVAGLQGELRSAKEQIASVAGHLARYAQTPRKAPPRPHPRVTSTCPDCGAEVPRKAYGGHRTHCEARKAAAATASAAGEPTE